MEESWRILPPIDSASPHLYTSLERGIFSFLQSARAAACSPLGERFRPATGVVGPLHSTHTQWRLLMSVAPFALPRADAGATELTHISAVFSRADAAAAPTRGVCATPSLRCRRLCRARFADVSGTAAAVRKKKNKRTTLDRRGDKRKDVFRRASRREAAAHFCLTFLLCVISVT